MFDYYWILSAEVLIWVQVEKAIASPKSLTVTDFSVQVVVDMAMSRKPTAAEPQRCKMTLLEWRGWEFENHCDTCDCIILHIFYRITFCTWSCCIWCPCRYNRITPTSINNSTLPCHQYAWRALTGRRKDRRPGTRGLRHEDTLWYHWSKQNPEMRIGGLELVEETRGCQNMDVHPLIVQCPCLHMCFALLCVLCAGHRCMYHMSKKTVWHTIHTSIMKWTYFTSCTKYHVWSWKCIQLMFTWVGICNRSQ